jgi:hypothetical protein
MTALASRSCDANVDAREAPTVLCRFFRHGVRVGIERGCRRVASLRYRPSMGVSAQRDCVTTSR